MKLCQWDIGLEVKIQLLLDWMSGYSSERRQFKPNLVSEWFLCFTALLCHWLQQQNLLFFHRVYSTQMRNYQQWEFTMWCWELCAQNTLPWEQKLHLTTNWVINLGSFHLISFCRPLPSRPHRANSSSVYITRLCLLLYDRLKVSILQLSYGRDNQSYVWHKQ